MIKGAVRHTFNTRLLFRSMCFDQVNGMTKVFISKNWEDTEKISLVPGVRMTRINREVYRNLFLLCVCACACFLPIHSGHQVRWTFQPGSHRRKVTQDFSSTFFLRCVPSFFSREGLGHSFPSSTVKSNFVY